MSNQHDPDIDDFEPLIIRIETDRAESVAQALDSMGTNGYFHVLYTKARTRHSPNGLVRRDYTIEEVAMGIIKEDAGLLNTAAKGVPPQFDLRMVSGVFIHIMEDEAVLFDIRFKGLMNYLMLEASDATR